MSDSRDDETLFFMDPDPRGVLPLDGLHISRSLRKFVRKSNWRVKFNSDFASVISECAQIDPDKNRHETWISRPIEELYKFLNENGHAFSVEVYQTDKLIGGLYGVSLGGAFFGESMFSRQTNASKIALIALVRGLKEKGYSLSYLESTISVRRYRCARVNTLSTISHFPSFCLCLTCERA